MQLTDLQKKRKMLGVAGFLRIPILAAAVACLFFSSLAAAIFVVLEVALQFGFIHPQGKRYMADCNRLNLENTVVPLLQDSVIEEKRGVSPELVRNTGLFPVGDHRQAVRGYWLIKGLYRQLSVEISDICVHYTYTANKVLRSGTFAGCWVHIELPEDAGVEYAVLDQQLIEPGAVEASLVRRGFGNVHTEKAGKDQRLTVYQKTGAYTPVSDNVFRQLDNLRNRTSGKFGVVLQGRSLSVLLKNRVLANTVSLSANPAAKDFQRNPLPELVDILNLAEVFAQNYKNKNED